MKFLNKLKKNKFFIFVKKNWVILLTIIYVAFVVIYTWLFSASKGENIFLSSDELGTFLSGFFAPIAFLFLIKGYLQQNRNLELLTYQINQLQADRKIRTYQARPIFEFMNGTIIEKYDESDFHGYLLQFSIKNIGKPVTNIKFTKVLDNEFVDGKLFKSDILSSRTPVYKMSNDTFLIVELKFESISINNFIGIDESGMEHDVIFYITYMNELGEYDHQRLKVNTFIDQFSEYSQFNPYISF